MSYPIRTFLTIMLILTGCSSTPDVKPEPKTTLTLTIIAGYDINNTRQEKAAPLQARLYELQNAELFEKADFLDIYLQDSAILQSSLIKKHPLPTIRPGSQITQTYTLDSATRYIAILGEFADYGSAVPSVVYAIMPAMDNQIALHINDNHLRLSTEPDNNQPSPSEAKDGS